jgi:hypothetical protein
MSPSRVRPIVPDVGIAGSPGSGTCTAPVPPWTKWTYGAELVMVNDEPSERIDALLMVTVPCT